MANSQVPFVLRAVILVGLLHPGMSQTCGGRLCSPTQYCNEEGTLCLSKKDLGDPCTGAGQCLPSYSDCLDQTCQCQTDWTEGPGNQCVLDCSDSTCSRGTFCSTDWSHGCIPQINLGQTCSDTEESPLQCRPDNAVCENSLCKCGSDFLEKNGACIPKCTSSSACRPEIEFCDINSGECLLKKPLGAGCTAAQEECATPNATCTGDVCSCLDGFSNYFNTACVPKCPATECRVDEYCDTGNEYCVRKANLHGPCNNAGGLVGQCADENALCHAVESTCECSPGFIDNNNQCVPTCTDNNGCSETNHFCNAEDPEEGFCEMKRPLGGTCTKEGESHECMEASGELNVICKNGRCSCNSEHYQSGGNCILKCSANSNCDPTQEFCNVEQGRCTPKIDLNGICNPTHPSSCRTENAICSEVTNRCSCVDSHVEGSGICILKCSASNPRCESDQFCTTGGACQTKPSLNQPCESGETAQQCQDPNASCTEVSEKLSCLCKDSHAENNAVCVARCENSLPCGDMYCDSNGAPNICKPKVTLGQACQYADQCGTEHATCDLEGSKTCQCSSQYYNYNNGLCLPKCTRDQGCLSSDYCTEEGRCEKKKPLGAGCTDSIQCKTPSAICDATCTCPNTHWEESSVCIQKCTQSTVCDPESQYCALNAKCYLKVGFNQSCTPGDDVKEQCVGKLVFCSTIPDSIRRKCICAENAEKEAAALDCSCTTEYVESQNALRCLRKATELDQPCEESAQCKDFGSGDSGAICSTGLCSCPARFIPDGTKRRCLLVAENLDESCEIDEQCAELGGTGSAASKCVANKCSCQTRFVPDGSKQRCLSVAENLQDGCEVDGQCAGLGGTGPATSKCVQNKCSCPNGFLDGSDRVTCRKAAEKLEDPCVENLQCEVLGEQTECKEAKCQCKAGFMAGEDAKQCVVDNRSGDGTRLGPVSAYFAICIAMVAKYLNL
ncbi:neurogenic locus Notch protein [Folsomia candida]|uniref:neurogenic locus Notch protein n=1 Tax=Folsomia candida TaxID=158441 RepID=UPI000B8F32AE|nr:neurogenic locus Notch protein [Folsomia candida]